MFFRRARLDISKVIHVGTNPPSNPFEGMLWIDLNIAPPLMKVYINNSWQTVEQVSHTHPPSDISPQGHGSGLDADMVDGYHASTVPNPGIIPVSDSNGIIGSEWLPNSIRSFENPIDPVAYYNQNGQDYPLQVGEVVKVTFSNTTSVPLRIATYDNTEYLMWIIPSDTGSNSGGGNNPIYLNPNNATYDNAFVYATVYRNLNSLGSSYTTYSSFRIGYNWAHVFCVIRNSMVYKNIIGIYDTYGANPDWPGMYLFSTDWRDTTTSWTSLGTVVFPQNSSGYILVKRIF